MPRDREEDDRFEEEYQAIPKGTWKRMQRAVSGDLRRKRQRKGAVERDEQTSRRREEDHRRGHGKHDIDGKRKREL